MAARGRRRNSHHSRRARPLEIEIERLDEPRRPLRPRSPTFQRAATAFHGAALVYALGGTAHVTATIWLLFLFGIYSLPFSPSRLAHSVWYVSVFWSWSIFTIVTLVLFWGPDRRLRALAVLGYVAALLVMGMLLHVAATPVLPLLDVDPLLHERALVLALAEAVTGTQVRPDSMTFSPFSQPILFWALSTAPVLVPALTFNRFVRGTVGPLFINMALTITVFTLVVLDLCVETSPGVRLIGVVDRIFGSFTWRH